MKKTDFRRFALYAINIGVILLMFFMLFQAIPAVLGAGLITIDGAFTDWTGQSCIPDPSGDGGDNYHDITSFCWANNPDVSNAYFYAVRVGGKGGDPVTYTLYIDTGNNGVFTDPNDLVVTIDYSTSGNTSSVTTSWHLVSGGGVGSSLPGAWGENKQNDARYVEWVVPFTAMGISAGQPIQMCLAANGSVVDTTGIVQWSPANALGWIMLGVILVGASVWMTFLSRKAARNSGKSSTDR